MDIKTFETHGFKNITPNDAYKLLVKDSILLDVRSSAYTAFKKFDVPEVLFCPHNELGDFLEKIPDNRLLIVADSVGLFSKEAMQILQKNGFRNILNLAGGIVEWERDGLPVIVVKNERLSGSCMCQLRPREK